MSGIARLVLIANIQILETLTDHLTLRGYEILRELPMITIPSIKDIILLNPDCIIISEGSQFDDGITLLKAIRTIKSQYKGRIIVQTQTRKIGDGLLSDLITLNVYDFIALSSFDLSEIIVLLENPREYADVSKYHNYAKESSTIDLPLELPQETEISLLKPTDIPEIPTVSTTNTKIVKSRMFGTTTISVAGLQHGSGSTHTVLATAQFLSDKGFKVAIVELKIINDYGLIYLPRDESYSQTSFRFKKIDIYANGGEVSSDDLLIAAMSKNYNYIILDAGLIFKYDLESASLDKPSTQIKKFEKGIFYNDFMKADVKLVNSFASIQYADSLEYLMNYINIWDITNLKILFSFTNEKTLKSYTKYSDSEMYMTPYNTDSSITEEQQSFYSSLLDEILPKESIPKVTLIGQSIRKCVSMVLTPLITGTRKIPKLIRRKQ